MLKHSYKITIIRQKPRKDYGFKPTGDRGIRYIDRKLSGV